jgi:hypothetical protein
MVALVPGNDPASTTRSPPSVRSRYWILNSWTNGTSDQVTVTSPVGPPWALTVAGGGGGGTVATIVATFDSLLSRRSWTAVTANS